MNMENKIKGLIKIINSEATLMIYNYLVIERIATPATLRKKLNIPKASVFRSIDLLVNCGIIVKEVLDEAIDGSKQGYTIQNTLEMVNDEVRTSEYYRNGGELVNKLNQSLLNFIDALNSAGKKILQENYDGNRLDLYTIVDLEVNEKILEEIFLLLEKLPRSTSSRYKISKPMSISLSVCGDLGKYLPELLSEMSQKKDG